ncbi:DUF3501 family protein [Pseudomonas sp. BN102]|uniref:DUF3501 family protein n=1 Tax=Pseudomonas sp. BN102 TaxID=2567886 RepID=UPI002456D1FB|nr:DUF3501 family protein [Pseudomonas sp. BN102]MDH4607125.1 DUF3501 family protein [Pseudomonas sp. BN102]
MKPLAREDLLSLENYAVRRSEFRARAITHKKARTVYIGEYLTLIFEDRLSIQYQVQEMLRIERIFEAEAIQDELDAYNPLIPGGDDLRATLMLEFPDVEQRRRELARLRGIEHAIELTVDDQAPVVAIADEDMPRSNEEKTSAVHFLRFALTATQISAWKAGAAVSLASTLAELPLSVRLSDEQHRALAADFD